MSVATRGEAWPVQSATVYYATGDGLQLYSKFQTSSDHAQSICVDARLSGTIYDHASNYHDKFGVQLRATCVRVLDLEEMREAVDLYSAHFPGARERFAPLNTLISPEARSTMYRTTIVAAKMVTPDGYSEHYQQIS